MLKEKLFRTARVIGCLSKLSCLSSPVTNKVGSNRWLNKFTSFRNGFIIT